MPIYAYKCEKCEHNFKIFHSPDDKPSECVKCLSTEIKKQFPPTNNIKIDEGKETAKIRVEKYIEETRESIKQQIEESRKDYIP